MLAAVPLRLEAASHACQGGVVIVAPRSAQEVAGF